MKYKLLIAGGCLIVIIVAMYFGYATLRQSQDTASAQPQETVTKRPPFKEPRTPPSGYAEYRSVFYRFQLLHPDRLAVAEYPVPVSAITLTFESKDKTKGFQIFIIPHGDPDITEYRLAQDLPSGVIEDSQPITIDGAEGKAFYSTDPKTGDTRELWFVSHGFLYEVSAPREHEAWLMQIMESWEFL